MLNKVILVGRLATDPELKYTPGGAAVTSFRLAVDRRGKDKETDFIDIVAWAQSAEFAANYLAKGRIAAIDGRLQIRNWVANDGTKRRTAEVHTNDLRAIDSAKSDRAPESAGAGDAGAAFPGDTDGDLEAFNDPFAV